MSSLNTLTAAAIRLFWRKADFLEHREIIAPFSEKQLWPASYMLTAGENYDIAPQRAINIWTAERVSIPLNTLGILSLKSQIARKGMLLNCSTLIDPGFEGHIVLEFFNGSLAGQQIKKGQDVAHLLIGFLTGPTEPYSGPFQKQSPDQGYRSILVKEGLT